MQTISRFVAVAALVSIVGWGCAQSPETSGTPEVDGAEATQPIALYCGDCGHSKDSEVCCDEDAAKCTDCGLSADSNLCCKLNEDVAGKDLCGKCGEIAGVETCCSDDAEKCSNCQLNAQSPLCCALENDATEAAPTTSES